MTTAAAIAAEAGVDDFLAQATPEDKLKFIRDEQAKILRNVRPLSSDQLVCGQFRGYRDEPGVSPTSNVPTYAALRLCIDSWRWEGVPFYVRAGKALKETMTDVIGATTAPRRFNALLLGAFAAIALVLATLGIYSVISYSITLQTQEIGIRMALGAQRSSILKMVLKKGIVLAVFGAVIGLVAAFALTRWMSSLLFGVSTTDTVTFVLVALVLTVVGVLACYLPARRATRVDPMVALRYE